jgi:predicted pyridoxine 5'-phosphate oxidase superfamily flavin-nucleotide-binding protein
VTDPFDGALERVEQLRELYDAAMEVAVTKDIGYLDEMCRRLIAASPMLFVATYSEEGQCDVSPRGGAPGFVTVLDDNHLAIPDATGNRRLDTLENVVASKRAGVIFVVPGRDTTLRVNGHARPAPRSSSGPRRSTRTAPRRSSAPSSGTRSPGPTRPACRRRPRSASRTGATLTGASSRRSGARRTRWSTASTDSATAGLRSC